MRQAEKASTVFKQFRKMAVDVGAQAARFIARGRATDEGLPWSEPRADQLVERLMPWDQHRWLTVAAHALVSQLLTVEEAKECRRWFAHAVHDEQGQPLQWVDEPGRRVISGATGIGKTVLAASLLSEVARRAQEAGGRQRLGSGGVIYAAGSVALLQDMWDLLVAMGCDMGAVGVHYGEERHQEEFTLVRTPLSQVPERFAQCPVVLTTQQWVNALSARRVNGDEHGFGLDELLAYGGKRRAGVWDEAFTRYNTDTRFRMPNLKTVRDAVQNHRFTEHHDGQVRRGAAVLIREVSRLERICDAASEGGKGEALLPPTLTAEDHQSLISLRRELRQAKEGSREPFIELLQRMSSSPQRMWAIPSENKQVQQVVCQPRLVVDELMDRLVILDASHIISLVRQADCTVEVAEGMRDAAGWLQPKIFDDVAVNIGHGPGGRTKLTTMPGKREKLITRQVMRMKEHVPENESILVITFKTKKASGAIDWRALVEEEMRRQKLSQWEQRVEFTTWGMHVGRNCWRHIRHIFCVGVLQRDWESDLKIQYNAVAETMENPVLPAGQTVQQAVAGEINAALQQLTGRGHCRVTIVRKQGNGRPDPKGYSGRLNVWLEMSEPGTNAAVSVEPGKSLICDGLREGMPGVKIISLGGAPRESSSRNMAEAGLAWLQEREETTSPEIRAMLRLWAASNHAKDTTRVLADAMAVIKLEALKAGWRIVGRSWSRKPEAKEMPAAPLTLQGQIVAEVLRLMPQAEERRVKFAEVKSRLKVTSQGKWSQARTVASAELERLGIEAQGRSWVRADSG
jgi:hypothetical protein